MRVTEEYEGRNSYYYLHLGQIGGILRAMGRFDEALDAYNELLADAHRNGEEYLIHLYSTNISVVYLELREPVKALHHLEDAIVLARQVPAIPDPPLPGNGRQNWRNYAAGANNALP